MASENPFFDSYFLITKGNSSCYSGTTGTLEVYILLIMLSANFINCFLNSTLGLLKHNTMEYGLVLISLFSEVSKKYLPKLSIPARLVLKDRDPHLNPK